jgi:hypothetical protein
MAFGDLTDTRRHPLLLVVVGRGRGPEDRLCRRLAWGREEERGADLVDPLHLIRRTHIHRLHAHQHVDGGVDLAPPLPPASSPALADAVLPRPAACRRRIKNLPLTSNYPFHLARAVERGIGVMGNATCGGGGGEREMQERERPAIGAATGDAGEGEWGMGCG